MTVDEYRPTSAPVIFPEGQAATADDLAAPHDRRQRASATDTDDSGGMWLHLLQRWLDGGRAAQQLACLPDHTLRDIGLDRTMIGQPVWPPRKLGDTQD